MLHLNQGSATPICLSDTSDSILVLLSQTSEGVGHFSSPDISWSWSSLCFASTEPSVKLLLHTSHRNPPEVSTTDVKSKIGFLGGDRSAVPSTLDSLISSSSCSTTSSSVRVELVAVCFSSSHWSVSIKTVLFNRWTSSRGFFRVLGVFFFTFT